MAENLSERQKRVFDVLDASAGQDVEIYKMYEACFEESVHVVQEGQVILGLTQRTMQQRLGAHLQRINEKLERKRIRPGDLKGTYRLEVVG